MSWAADGQDEYRVQQIWVNFFKFIAVRLGKLAKS